jgi:hypothetical protein
MALQNGQIPILANVLNSDVAIFNSAGSGQAAGVVGTDTNGVTGYTAGATRPAGLDPAGGRVYSVLASSSAAVNYVFVYILRGTKVLPLGQVAVLATAGNAATALVKNTDFLDGVNILGLPVDNTGKRYIPLQENDQLKFSVNTAIAAGATRIYISCYGADYQQIS